MMHPYRSIALLIVLVVTACLVVSCDYAPATRVVNCDLVEFHPDLVKYREACRQMRGAR